MLLSILEFDCLKR